MEASTLKELWRAGMHMTEDVYVSTVLAVIVGGGEVLSIAHDFTCGWYYMRMIQIPSLDVEGIKNAAPFIGQSAATIDTLLDFGDASDLERLIEDEMEQRVFPRVTYTHGQAIDKWNITLDNSLIAVANSPIEMFAMLCMYPTYCAHNISMDEEPWTMDADFSFIEPCDFDLWCDQEDELRLENDRLRESCKRTNEKLCEVQVENAKLKVSCQRGLDKLHRMYAQLQSEV